MCQVAVQNRISYLTIELFRYWNFLLALLAVSIANGIGRFALLNVSVSFCTLGVIGACDVGRGLTADFFASAQKSGGLLGRRQFFSEVARIST